MRRMAGMLRVASTRKDSIDDDDDIILDEIIHQHFPNHMSPYIAFMQKRLKKWQL